MEEIQDVVQKSAVGNLHQIDAILLCSRKHLDARKGVREQVVDAVLVDVHHDLKDTN